MPGTTQLSRSSYPVGLQHMFRGLLWLALVPASSALCTEVSLSFEVDGGSPSLQVGKEGISAKLRFFGEGQEDREQSADIRVGGTVHVDAKPGDRRLEVLAPGFWARPLTIDLGKSEQQATVTLHPTGKVFGKPVFPKGTLARLSREEPPWVSFEVPPAAGVPGSGSPDAFRGRVPCSVTTPTRIECELPAALLDLQIESRGFSSAFRWDVRIRPGALLDLGAVEFGPASGIVGWVLTEGAQGAGGGIDVEVRPRSAKTPKESSRVRAEALLKHTTTDHRGFFRLHDLAPGAYVLAASREGYATTRTSVRVVADRLSEVVDPPLILRAAQNLEIYVDPPTPPSVLGGVWEAHLEQVDRGGARLQDFVPSDCSAAGVGHVEDLARGLYKLRILDPAGKMWASRELDFTAGVTTTFMDVPVVEVRGTVVLGEEPLEAASVFFAGSSGIEMVSNEEGRFSGFLPRPGAWSIEVRASEPRLRRNFKSVEIEVEPPKSYAELELDMPDTRMQGEVVDALGRSVDNAIVSATGYAASLDSFAQQRTDEDGAFDFAGLPPGRFILRAEIIRDGKQMQSPKQEMDLQSQVEHEPIRLVVEEALNISGCVVSQGRGVPGAMVKMHAAQAMEIAVGPQTTDFDGRFEVDFPPGTREVMSGVGAPGFGYKIGKLRVDESQELVIEISQEAGALVLDNIDPEQPRMLLVAHQNGFEAAIFLARNWARTVGVTQTDPTRFVIPDLEAGDYAACWVNGPNALKEAALTGLPPASGCVSGHLPAAGELVLEMP